MPSSVRSAYTTSTTSSGSTNTEARFGVPPPVNGDVSRRMGASRRRSRASSLSELYGLDLDTNGQCDGFDASRNLDHFDDTYPNHGQAIALGTLVADDTGDADKRWFRVFVRLDPAAGNAVQGRLATFGITWRLVQ